MSSKTPCSCRYKWQVVRRPALAAEWCGLLTRVGGGKVGQKLGAQAGGVVTAHQNTGMKQRMGCSCLLQ